MRIKLFFFTFILILFHSCSMAQHVYIKPDTSVIVKYLDPEFNSKQFGFYDTTQSLPSGYNKNGNVDYTQYLQKAIEQNERVLLPNFPVLINNNGLIIPSNKTVVFQKYSQIIYSGPARQKLDDIIKIYNAENVKVYNANIVGSKFSKFSQEGQWSAGISILNSRNIEIINSRIKDTYGDGIFIGSEDGGFSENVRIDGAWIDNARRNGISITSAKNIYVHRVLISNTFGHDPQCGIDIEPSWYKDVIENVNITNVYTFNNALAGIEINMQELNNPLVVNPKSIGINISNHTDNMSKHALLTSLHGANRTKYDVKGNINIMNSKWLNSKDTNIWINPNDYNIKMNFKDIQIKDTIWKSRTLFKDEVKGKKYITLQ